MHENKKKRFSLLNLVGLIAAIVAVVAIAGIIRELNNYHEGEKTYSDLKNQYAAPVETEDEQPEELKKPYKLLDVDFATLQAQNPDVIGWIDFDAFDLSYPIVWSGDNEKYLRTMWNGQPNSAGSIFMEGANTSLDDLHVILYGHNMRNRTMFGNLREYRKEEFYQEHGGGFTLYTPEATWRYEIFSVKQIRADNPLYTVGYLYGEAYTKFLERACQSRFYDTGVTVYSEDHVMTLSTCVDDDDQRLVVMARRAEQIA